MQLVDRRTGQLVDVPDPDVQKAFQSGLFGLPKGARLPVSTPGVIGTVDAKDAAQALATGSTVPTTETFHKAQMEARYGDAAGTAGAAAAGLLRGAGEAVGVPTDPFLANIGALATPNFFEGERNMRERLQAYKDLHPVASIGGELGGLVAATALSGGEAPLARLGAAAEAGGGLIARGAAEGAAIGGINAVNESALGDTDLTASKLVAGMGEGALFGGALGAGFQGLGLATREARAAGGRFLAKLAPADVERVAEKTFGYAPEGLGQKVQRFYAKAASAVSGKDPELVAKFTDLSPEGAEARRIGVFDAPKIQEEAERGIRTNLDEMLRSGDLVTAEARGSLKADYVAKAVRKGNVAETTAFAENQLGRLIEGADAELTHADGVAPQMVKPLETVSRAAYRAQEAVASGDNARIFVELDNVKRAVQKLTSTGYRSVPNIADPLEQIQARRTVDWMRGAAEDLRTSLEREDLWGKAAADQREINAAWTKQIDASQRFHKALTTETVRNPDNPYVRLRGADPAKVASYVRNLTNPNNDLTHQAVRDYVESTQNVAKAISKAYDLPPDKVAEVAKVARATEQFGSHIQRAEKALVTANQYEALTKGGGDSLAGLASAVGFAAGGLPGGAVGSLVGAVAHPGRTVAQLAAIERMVTKVDARIGSSLRSFFRGGSSARPALHEAATPEGFDRTVKLLSEAVDADGKITPAGAAKIGDALGDLHEGAPKIATSAAATMARVLTFLASKLPPAMRDPNDMFPGDEPALVSDTERETFARYFTAATNPTSVFEHMAHGDVTPEEAEALKACHLPLYAEAGEKAIAMATDAAAKGKPLDYDRRVTLGVVFEQRTDATLGHEVMAAVGAARAKRGGGGAGGGGMRAGMLRPAKMLAPRFMTTFEASASRRKGGI